MSSVIDDENAEHLNSDPDPSSEAQPIWRVRRSAVMAGFMALAILGGLAVFGLLAAKARTDGERAQVARAATQASGFGGVTAPDTYTRAQQAEDAQTSRDSGSASPLPTMVPKAAAEEASQSAGTDANGAASAGASTAGADPPTATQTGAQNEVQERQRLAFAAELDRQRVQQMAMQSDLEVPVRDGVPTAPVASTTASSEPAPSGTATPTSSAAPASTSRPGGAVRPSGRFKLRAGDWIDGVVQPDVNAEAAGVVSIYVDRNIYDSGTGSLILIPRGAIVLGIPMAPVAGQSRIQLRAPSLAFPGPHGKTVDLSAIAADSDGTTGIGAHVDDHHWQVLSIAGIGGALSGLATAVQPTTISSSGITVAVPSAQQQVVSGAGASILQTAGNLATAKMNRPPTLTTSQARHVILYLEKDLYLDPYCDQDRPASPECAAKEALVR